MNIFFLLLSFALAYTPPEEKPSFSQMEINHIRVTTPGLFDNEKLLELQRNLAAANDVIMDGRDIGTVVLPNAECKIYLTASSFVRANRRYKELIEKGETCDLAQIEKDIIARDEQDMNREIAPLKQAEDAVYLDSSDLSIDEVVNKIIEIQGASAHDN